MSYRESNIDKNNIGSTKTGSGLVLDNMKYKSIPLIRIRMGEGFRRPLI